MSLETKLGHCPNFEYQMRSHITLPPPSSFHFALRPGASSTTIRKAGDEKAK